MPSNLPPPGMGAGAGAAIFGELARTSTNKERTAVFSVFMSMRQIGLIIGTLCDSISTPSYKVYSSSDLALFLSPLLLVFRCFRAASDEKLEVRAWERCY